MNNAAIKETKKSKKIKKAKKPIYKRVWFWLAIFIIAVNVTETEPEASHIYDTAQVIEQKVGEYSLIKVDSSEVTVEALEDWYFNYIKENDFNCNIIIYTDKAEPTGVYAIDSLVIKDMKFETDENGDYWYGDDNESTYYSPSDDGHLVEINFEN